LGGRWRYPGQAPAPGQGALRASEERCGCRVSGGCTARCLWAYTCVSRKAVQTGHGADQHACVPLPLACRAVRPRAARTAHAQLCPTRARARAPPGKAPGRAAGPMGARAVRRLRPRAARRRRAAGCTGWTWPTSCSRRTGRASGTAPAAGRHAHGARVRAHAGGGDAARAGGLTGAARTCVRGECSSGQRLAGAAGERPCHRDTLWRP
jgi:hypothetical protein